MQKKPEPTTLDTHQNIHPPQPNSGAGEEPLHRSNQRPSDSAQRIEPREYHTSNGCSKKPSWQQVLAFLLVVGLIVVHSLLVGDLVGVGQPMLIVLMVFHYMFLLAVAVDYVILLAEDPVDPRLLPDWKSSQEPQPHLIHFCEECNVRVHVYSYHCHTCNRCAEEFDHHCTFLNNCIGRKNYHNFFRILLTLTVWLMITIGEGVWVAIRVEGGWRWVAVAMAIYSFLLLPQVIVLMCFHLYLSLFLYKTTLQYLRGQVNQEQLQQEERQYQERTPKRGRSTDSMKTSEPGDLPTQTQMRRDQALP